MLRKDDSELCKKYIDYVVECARSRSRPKRWQLKDDMKSMNVSKADTLVYTKQTSHEYCD